MLKKSTGFSQIERISSNAQASISGSKEKNPEPREIGNRPA